MTGGILAKQHRGGDLLAAATLAAAAFLARQFERRRSRLASLELSDAQLKDIGLSRSEAYGLSCDKAYAEAWRRLG